MIINDLLDIQHMSMYRLSKLSGVPYATVNDICSGKRDIAKCEAGTVYNLANALGISVDKLLASCMVHRSSFEHFKSTICHQVKDLGDIGFILDVLENDKVNELYKKKWYPEALYLLAMLDYLSSENDIPLCTHYDKLRMAKLSAPIYPVGTLITSKALNSQEPIREALQNAIPEFLRHNIIESEVRNVL